MTAQTLALLACGGPAPTFAVSAHRQPPSLGERYTTLVPVSSGTGDSSDTLLALPGTGGRGVDIRVDDLLARAACPQVVAVELVVELFGRVREPRQRPGPADERPGGDLAPGEVGASALLLLLTAARIARRVVCVTYTSVSATECVRKRGLGGRRSPPRGAGSPLARQTARRVGQWWYGADPVGSRESGARPRPESRTTKRQSPRSALPIANDRTANQRAQAEGV
jgi:hypothetical protein